LSPLSFVFLQVNNVKEKTNIKMNVNVFVFIMSELLSNVKQRILSTVIMSGLVTANVLELCLVRFETISYRNITDKDIMFVAICKAKIIVPAKRPLLQML
jgi:hypothetical protein